VVAFEAIMAGSFSRHLAPMQQYPQPDTDRQQALPLTALINPVFLAFIGALPSNPPPLKKPRRKAGANIAYPI
jgi:hypothetical protein